MNGHYNLEGEFVENSAETETVNEIIREENAPTTLEEIRREIIAMTTLNHVLNTSLQAQILQVSDMQKRIDNMLALAEREGDRIDRVIHDALEHMTRGGTHRDKDENQLQAIGHLLGVISTAKYLKSLLVEAARGAKAPKQRDMDDIPW